MSITPDIRNSLIIAAIAYFYTRDLTATLILGGASFALTKV